MTTMQDRRGRHRAERRKEAEEEIRDQAIANVDGRFGYTADRVDHRTEYAEEEARLWAGRGGGR